MDLNSTMASPTNSTSTSATVTALTNTITPTVEEPPPSEINRNAVIVVSMVIFVFGVLGNGAICYGFCRFRQLRTLTNYFVFNLAVADLFLISALGAWIVHEFRGNPPQRVLIALLINMDVLCFSASMLNMTAVSLDRFCAVTYPLRYEQIITKSRARKATVLIWLYSLVMAGVGVTRYLVDEMSKPDVHRIFVTVVSAISFLIPAIIMIITNLCIFRIAWASKQRAHYDLQDVETARANEITKTLKLSFNTLVILVPMVTAWGIFYVVTVLEVYSPDSIQLSLAFSVTVGILPHVAAAIDPIVYILVTRNLRLKLFACS